MNHDELVKTRNSKEFVIPAEAGIQLFQKVLDPGFRRGDASRDFFTRSSTIGTITDYQSRIILSNAHGGPCSPSLFEWFKEVSGPEG
jgi:hypothetical protein